MPLYGIHYADPEFDRASRPDGHWLAIFEAPDKRAALLKYRAMDPVHALRATKLPYAVIVPTAADEPEYLNVQQLADQLANIFGTNKAVELHAKINEGRWILYPGITHRTPNIAWGRADTPAPTNLGECIVATPR